MRKILSLIGMLAAVVLLFASCSKENSSSIVGTWRLEESVTTTYVNGTFYDSQVSILEGEYLFEFKSDGTIRITENNKSNISTTSGTYMIVENTLILNINKLGIGDKIEVESQKVTIEALTSTTLMFSSESSYSNGGKNYTYVGKSTLRRVK